MSSPSFTIICPSPGSRSSPSLPCTLSHTLPHPCVLLFVSSPNSKSRSVYSCYGGWFPPPQKKKRREDKRILYSVSIGCSVVHMCGRNVCERRWKDQTPSHRRPLSLSNSLKDFFALHMSRQKGSEQVKSD